MFVPVEATTAGERDAGADEAAGLNGLVVLHTKGPRLSECFVLQRRECYWSILDVHH